MNRQRAPQIVSIDRDDGRALPDRDRHTPPDSTSLDRQRIDTLAARIAGIAHDCNNLLSGALAQADLALADSGSENCATEAIRTAKEMVIRASEILRELMICAGHERASVEPLDLSAIVGEMLPLLRVLVPKNVEIRTELGGEQLSVTAGGPRLRQVVLNLVINAAEAFDGQSGKITISTRRAIRYHDSVLAGGAHLPPGDYVVLKVSDSGPGMAEAVRARVFGPSFTTKPSGRGLGLCVVRDIVRECKGVIELETAPGAGSAFSIFLPAAVTVREQRRLELPGPFDIGPIPAAICVLVVEDQDALRGAVSSMLRKRGFEVLEAADGYGAAEVFRKSAPVIDVVLLDLTMAGASSLHCFVDPRSARRLPRIVLTSAYSREVALAGLDWTPAAFIRKPYEISDLIRLLRTAVSPYFPAASQVTPKTSA